jgi:hypothetical protein
VMQLCHKAGRFFAMSLDEGQVLLDCCLSTVSRDASREATFALLLVYFIAY